MSNDRISRLEASVEALQAAVTAQQEAIVKLRGANDVLGKRILEEVKKAQRTRVL